MSSGNGSQESAPALTQTDARTALQQAAFAVNALMGVRRQLAAEGGQSAYGGNRNYNLVFGYPRELSFSHYLTRYKRQDIAGRIVDLPAQDTWKRHPAVTESGDADTEFSQAWSALNDRLGTFGALARADRISGIGRYGVLYVGLRSDSLPSAPVKAGSLDSPGDVLFLRPFSEGNATINTWDKVAGSARFGLPETYKLTVDGGSQLVVHHSRILHLADNRLDSDVYGIPRLQRVYNRLDDLMKLVGGTAEATWLNMRPGTLLTTRDGYDFADDDDARAAIQNEIEEYLHGLARVMTIEGADLKQLAGQVMDPTGPFDVAVSLIAAASGIPQRVLLGSAAGELASAQEDKRQWYGAVAHRQTNYAEPLILRPFIDKLITAGALPAPTDGYNIGAQVSGESDEWEWPSLFEHTAQEEAELVSSAATAVLALQDPVTLELPLTDGEIRQLLGYPEERPEEQRETEPAEELPAVAQIARANLDAGAVSPDLYREWLLLELEGADD